MLREEWAALSLSPVCPCPREAQEPAQGDGHGELGQRSTWAEVSTEGEIRHYLQDHVKGRVLRHVAGEEEITHASCFTFF